MRDPLKVLTSSSSNHTFLQLKMCFFHIIIPYDNCRIGNSSKDVISEIYDLTGNEIKLM